MRCCALLCTHYIYNTTAVYMCIVFTRRVFMVSIFRMVPCVDQFTINPAECTRRQGRQRKRQRRRRLVGWHHVPLRDRVPCSCPPPWREHRARNHLGCVCVPSLRAEPRAPEAIAPHRLYKFGYMVCRLWRWLSVALVKRVMLHACARQRRRRTLTA